MRLEIQSEEELQLVLALAAPLLGAGASASAGAADVDAGEESSGAAASGLDAGEEVDWDEFGEEQCLLARTFWLCRAPSGDTQYLVRPFGDLRSEITIHLLILCLDHFVFYCMYDVLYNVHVV